MSTSDAFEEDCSLAMWDQMRRRKGKKGKGEREKERERERGTKNCLAGSHQLFRALNKEGTKEAATVQSNRHKYLWSECSSANSNSNSNILVTYFLVLADIVQEKK